MLEKCEVQELMLTKLTFKLNEINDEIVNDLYIHSSGMPNVAAEILGKCLHKFSMDLPKKQKRGE